MKIGDRVKSPEGPGRIRWTNDDDGTVSVQHYDEGYPYIESLDGIILKFAEDEVELWPPVTCRHCGTEAPAHMEEEATDLCPMCASKLARGAKTLTCPSCKQEHFILNSTPTAHYVMCEGAATALIRG